MTRTCENAVKTDANTTYVGFKSSKKKKTRNKKKPRSMQWICS